MKTFGAVLNGIVQFLLAAAFGVGAAFVGADIQSPLFGLGLGLMAGVVAYLIILNVGG